MSAWELLGAVWPWVVVVVALLVIVVVLVVLVWVVALVVRAVHAEWFGGGCGDGGN